MAIGNGKYVRQFMRRGAITCSEETSLKDIAQIMIVNQVRYCVVINKLHEVRGLISANSIIDAYGNDLENVKARDILKPEALITTTMDSPIEEAIDLMGRVKTEHLVVLSDRPGSRAVLGILYAGDIVAAMAGRTEEEL
jgi:CBS domain-containing protein